MKNSWICLFIFSSLVIGVLCQDCDDSAERCVDHGQCCGGCCYHGECISTYRLCSITSGVCKDHSCIGEQNCYEYTPPQCPGCEARAICA